MAEEQPGPHLGIERIYLRDASFESPRAPGVFDNTWTPQVQVDINSRSSRLDESRHEVVLTLTLKAHVDDEVAMIVELQQAGVFRLEGMNDDLRRQGPGRGLPERALPLRTRSRGRACHQGGVSALSCWHRSASRRSTPRPKRRQTGAATGSGRRRRHQLKPS